MSFRAFKLSSFRAFGALALVACPGQTPPNQPGGGTAVVCPEGSIYDAQQAFCVAAPPVPIATAYDAGAPVATVKDAGATPVATAADAGIDMTGVSITARIQPPGTNVVVSCDFSDGWVSLLPVSQYPKDDSFLMQSLIGLTEDPGFWKGIASNLKPWAAKKCPRTGVGYTLAAGDYWVLGGQANTFGSKGKYDKNGVKRKITVTTTVQNIDLKPVDLTHTWLCISCPWIVMDGLVPFPILVHRDNRSKEGTDTIHLVHVPVKNGRVRIRVSERERETTWLDRLRVVHRGISLPPALGHERSALASADHVPVVLARGTEIAVEYEVGDLEYVDLDLVATGHYVEDAPLPIEKEPLYVVDLHVDLGYATHARKQSLDDPSFEVSRARLAAGASGELVVPLFVEDAFAMKPQSAREAYAATFASLARSGVPIPIRLSFEGADGFADDVRSADDWIARGAVLFGLVHSRSNGLGGASQDPDPVARKRGLTEKGKALATHLVEKGALLDLAHASDTTQDDLVAIASRANAPLVDSHTGMRALRAIDRNLDDAHAKMVAASNGVIGISLHSGHVASGDRATLDDYILHLEHAIEVAGEDHVAIGSDLAGAITEPIGADGAATWPTLAERLRARGWSDARLHAVFHENAERVFRWSDARR